MYIHDITYMKQKTMLNILIDVFDYGEEPGILADE
jgi:hypothetical protein